MIDSPFFLNSNWLWLVLIISTIGILVFVWKELKSPIKQGRVIRYFLGVLAVVCLAAIALRPTTEVKATTQGFVLLTEGANKSQLDSLLKADPALQLVDYKIGRTIFPEGIHPEFVYVFGNGIAPFDLWQLEEVPTSFFGGNAPTGLVELSYSNELYVGDILTLKGTYDNAIEGHRLVLEGFDGVGLDSLVFDLNNTSQLELNATLKVAGNYLYQLVEKNAAGEIQHAEPIPVSILAKPRLSITIINTFPSFETKYLKNFLAEEGHLLTVRSQVTRGRFKYEYFNRQNDSESILSNASFKATDLLIMDVGAMNQLSSEERVRLKNNIQKEGMGLLVQPELSLFGRTHRLVPLKFKRRSGSSVVLKDLSEKKLKRYLFDFVEDPRLKIIHSDIENLAISGMKRNGKGSIGTTLLSNTYELQLGGQLALYKKIWSDIIAELSKKKVPLTEWTSASILGFENLPYEFVVRTAIENPIVTNEEGSRIPLQQDLYLPNTWKGTLYPLKTGWDQLKLENDTLNRHMVYTSDLRSWKSITAANTTAANARFFSTNISPQTPIFTQIPINRLWFFIPFLLCMGYLWFEPKWRN